MSILSKLPETLDLVSFRNKGTFPEFHPFSNKKALVNKNILCNVLAVQQDNLLE